MKKSKLLVLPLVAVLLSSCATSIKSSEIPELSKEPGYVLKMISTSSVSGDKDIMASFSLEKAKSKFSVDFYTNYIKASDNSSDEDGSEKVLNYVMFKNNVTYSLTEKDGTKSKTEVTDPLEIAFKAALLLYKTPVTAGLALASLSYERMRNIDETAQLDKTINEYTLTRAINTYTLTIVRNEDGYEIQSVTKITFKNDYFSSFEVSSKISKDKKSATNKSNFKFTFGAEERTFDESKMPDLTKYAK